MKCTCGNPTKPMDEGGDICIICARYFPEPDAPAMVLPKIKMYKKPICESLARDQVTDNIDKIKALRKKHVSFRAITERLGLQMNHTTLQKWVARIYAGDMEIVKRGRKAAA